MGNFPSNFPILLRTPRAFPHASPSNRRPVRPFGRGAWAFCATAAYKRTTTRPKPRNNAPVVFGTPRRHATTHPKPRNNTLVVFGIPQWHATTHPKPRNNTQVVFGILQWHATTRPKPRNNAPRTPQHLLPHAKSPVNLPTPCKSFSIFSVATTTSSCSSYSKS